MKKDEEEKKKKEEQLLAARPAEDLLPKIIEESVRKELAKGKKKDEDMVDEISDIDEESDDSSLLKKQVLAYHGSLKGVAPECRRGSDSLKPAPKERSAAHASVAENTVKPKAPHKGNRGHRVWPARKWWQWNSWYGGNRNQKQIQGRWKNFNQKSWGNSGDKDKKKGGRKGQGKGKGKNSRDTKGKGKGGRAGKNKEK